jgi:hypothetical protein
LKIRCYHRCSGAEGPNNSVGIITQSINMQPVPASKHMLQ